MKIEISNKLFLRTNQTKSGRQSLWMLHGFGDSGLVYKEVFESPLNDRFNLFVIDLPGFGVSPINPDFLSIKEQATLVSKVIEEKTSKLDKINLVAHSLGALIGTWVCQNMKERVNHYFNIEGNLTQADSYFSSKPLKFASMEEFVVSFKEEIFEIAKSDERYKRYFSSLSFAEAEGMKNWSLTSQEHILGNKCAKEFMELQCKKIYVWGDIDTPQETQKFIQENKIPNKLYKGIGHWHMVENSKEFYCDIYEKLSAE